MVVPLQLNAFNSDCNQQQDAFGITVGVVLLVGTFISYAPQLVKLIWEKTTEGLSFEYMFLTLIYNWTVSLNAVLLQWDILICANQVGFGQYNVLLLSLDIIVAQVVCNLPIYLVMFYYYKWEPTKEKMREWKIATICLAVFFVMAICSSSIAFLLGNYFGMDSDIVHDYAVAFGIIANVVTVFQIAPQIYATFRLKAAGSLSIITLVIQAPGTTLLVYFQAFVYHVSWSTWVPYFLTAVQMVFLTFLCIFYEVRIWWRKRKLAKSSNPSTTPLLFLDPIQ